jgi:hypothetical protein
MATAYKVLKNTARAGNAIIGAGCYSAVLQHGKPHECKVIKIANTTMDPWLDYYNEIVVPMNTNCHTPEVSKVYIDHYNEYYVANMEELDPECYDLDDDDDFDRYNLAENISQLVVGEITQSEFEDIWAEFRCVLFPWGFGEFYKVVDALIDHTDVLTSEDELCNDMPEEEVRKLDIHAGNIMFRRGCVVITDPWCNLAVDDHPSMETYVEESNDRHIAENYYIG